MLKNRHNRQKKHNNNRSLRIRAVAENSPAAQAGIKSGDCLIAVNNKPISDVLDYKFLTTAERLTLKLDSGKVRLTKDEYEDLGLEFDTYLMSDKRRCKNNCIFCFIDQMPKNMRETLYFKDDDARLSFLQGNYITLTNLTDDDVARIIRMKLNVNVSVHTLNPALRSAMLRNPTAGEKLEYLYKMAKAGIAMNCQLVLCKGINDGEELRRSLEGLCSLYPAVQSVACVPAGLTKWRENLTPLEPYSKEEAAAVLDIIEEYGNKCYVEKGDRLVYPSDEFFLLSGREIPDYEYYGDFRQYENGVGMESLLEHEFREALETENPSEFGNKSIATGVLAAPLIEKLVGLAGADIKVYAVKNRFFGESITVSGLVTGGDLIEQLTVYKNLLGDELLIPCAMLKKGESVFLDDVTVADVERTLRLKVTAVENSGGDLLRALMRSI